MRNFLRLVGGSLGVGAFFCVLMWSIFETVDEQSSNELTQSMRTFWARIVESGPPQQSLDKLMAYRDGIPMFTSSLWVVRDDGTVLASNSSNPLPEFWRNLPHPVRSYDSSQHGPLGTVRLKTAEARYLVIRTNDPPIFRQNMREKIARGFLLFTGVGLIVLLALFFYLRRKSAEAKSVLLRLEKGDLGARFHIQRLDQAGSLMLDFNRMADEIERLVGRLHEAEEVRRTLLQELGHDLRTPLMSLRASFDGLGSDSPEMKPEHRARVLQVCQGEVEYLANLVDSLLFVAAMDELHYRPTETVDLLAMVREQLARLEGGNPQIEWRLRPVGSLSAAPLVGDFALLQRMVRNLFENAARFAASEVEIAVSVEPLGYRLVISNNGPLMTDAQLAQYGRYRTHPYARQFRSGRVSLGLGSVIIMKIVELHRGKLAIRNENRGAGPQTVVDVFLPLQ